MLILLKNLRMMNYKKVNQKDVDFLNSRKALTKSVKSAVKKIFQLKKMN